MKTQDKIYVPIIDMGVEEGGDNMVPLWWNSNKLAEHPELKGMVEYIRKDALLEWAKEELGDTSILRSETIEVLQKVIDKINSL